MNLKFLAVVVILCSGMLYWSWRNATEIDRIQKEAFQSGLSNNLEMEDKIKGLEKREADLLQQNGDLIVQVNELKMEVTRLLKTQNETSKSTTKHEKSVPISKSASKRITDFLAKRYENQ